MRWGMTVAAGFLIMAGAGSGQEKGKFKKGDREGEIITPAAKAERKQDTLKMGDRAPDFTLADPHGKNEVKLSSFRGKKPVVLIFGSYT